MSQYFPPYSNSSKNVKVELHLSNYITKEDIKDITHVDTSSYALKANLAALNTELDNIDTDKLKIVPNDLAKLSNLSDCNRTRTHNHLVHKRTLNHLAKLAK